MRNQEESKLNNVWVCLQLARGSIATVVLAVMATTTSIRPIEGRSVAKVLNLNLRYLLVFTWTGNRTAPLFNLFKMKSAKVVQL